MVGNNKIVLLVVALTLSYSILIRILDIYEILNLGELYFAFLSEHDITS